MELSPGAAAEETPAKKPRTARRTPAKPKTDSDEGTAPATRRRKGAKTESEAAPAGDGVVIRMAATKPTQPKIKEAAPASESPAAKTAATMAAPPTEAPRVVTLPPTRTVRAASPAAAPPAAASAPRAEAPGRAEPPVAPPPSRDVRPPASSGRIRPLIEAIRPPTVEDEPQPLDHGGRYDRGVRGEHRGRNDRGPRGGQGMREGGREAGLPLEEGGGRRRRRRRRGRGRGGREEGADNDFRGGGPRGQRRGEPQPPVRPEAILAEQRAFEEAELLDEAGRVEPGLPPEGVYGAEEQRPLSRSQKRRLRRKRRMQQRTAEGGGAPVAGEPFPPPVDRPTVLAPLPVDFGGADEDEHEMDERLEAREVLESEDFEERADAVDTPDVDEVEIVEPDDATETEEEPAEAAPPGRKGRRGDRRRGRQSRPRRRDRAESDDADSRVFGEGDKESPVVEIEPEDDGRGLDALTVIDVGDAAPPLGDRKREMIVNIVPGEECRIAIVEDGKLEQIYLERASSENHVGNIYKGVVTNVEPSIQAAFIDFGLGKNGFLHISDLHPRFFPGASDERTENVGRKMPRKARPPIQKCLRRGQELLVQITKEGIGTKGPTLTTYLSVPGRFLVMMPGMRQLGVSRKIEDEDLRRKLRAQLNELDLPDDIGFIARTAAEDRTRKELQSDLNYLTRLWRAVEKRIDSERAPAELYRDSDLVIRTIRDVFSTDVERIIVDDADVAARATEFLSIFSPKAHDIVVHYSDPMPIFHKYGIEAELERLHSRHVPLRNGGSLVIDQTEALVAIDVNSGKFRMEDDAETTAFKLNMEAADEIPRQLRLRDLGGVIICDFIDMRMESHRREIERRLILNLKQHKERAKVLRMSQFGIIEMTRQRQRASLTRSVYQDCHHCRGTGLIKTSESVALDVMRLLQLMVTREHIRSIEVVVSPEVAYLLQNRKRSAVFSLEQAYRRSISLKPDATYSLDQLQIHCYDHRGRLVPHP